MTIVLPTGPKCPDSPGEKDLHRTRCHYFIKFKFMEYYNVKPKDLTFKYNFHIVQNLKKKLEDFLPMRKGNI